MNQEYNTLVLSGGGLKGFLLLGSLQFLFDSKRLDRKKIKKYIGTSIGAIINTLLILDYQPKEIIVELIQNKTFDEFQLSALDGIGFRGFFDFEKISKTLRTLIEKKLEKIPTIKEFCELYNIFFLAICFNYTKQTEFTISLKNSPNLNLLDALRMTSNVPFLFNFFEHEGDQIFDGFLTNNYPIDHIDKNQDTALGIYTKTDTENKENDISKWSMFWNIIHIPLNQLQKFKRQPFENSLDHICLQCDSIFDLDYNVKPKVILDHFSDGYNQSRKIISSECTK